VSDEERNASWARIRDVIVFLCTIGTSVASLSGWTRGASEIVLRVIAGLSGGYILWLTARWSWAIRKGRRSQARKRLREFEADVVDTVSRLAEANEEKVHLRVTVGLRDGDDVVESEVEVDPDERAGLVQRLIRPVATHGQIPSARLSDISFQASVDESSNGPAGVRCQAVPVRGRLYVWMIFSPTLTKPVTWRCSYSPPRLWADLRMNGYDSLGWTDVMPAGGRSPMRDFRLTFVFKDPAFRPNVKENNEFGTVMPARRGPCGSWIIEWHDPSPQGKRYDWRITRVPDSTSS
jgi:hypothetical protein